MTKPAHFGVLAALISILYVFLLYFIEKQLIINPFVSSLRYVIFIVCAWLAVGRYRVFMEDKKVLASWIKPAFITFVVASSIYTIFYFVLYRYIDTDLYTMSAEYIKEHFPESQAKGTPGRSRTIDEMSVEEAVSVSRTILSLAREIIIGFIFSAVIALIWRNK